MEPICGDVARAGKTRAELTFGHVVRALALLVHHDDDHQGDDLRQHAQERPEGGQVAADPQDRLCGRRADDVGGVALVIARVRVDVQVQDVQLSVVIVVDDDETPR